jgi:hypothetical protein
MRLRYTGAMQSLKEQPYKQVHAEYRSDEPSPIADRLMKRQARDLACRIHLKHELD